MGIIKVSGIRGFSFKWRLGSKSITLLELVIAISIMSIMVLTFYSLETYSHGRVIFSDRRTKLQNDLNYAMEHMSKYVSQANGTGANPGIVVTATGFQVGIDMNNLKSPAQPQTPGDTTDDVTVSYSLASNTLSATCGPAGRGCPSSFPEDFSNRIISGFSNTVMPNPPVKGFYVKRDPDSLGVSGSNIVEVGLVGRSDPTSVSSLSNPQVSMKTRLICNNCSTN